MEKQIEFKPGKVALFASIIVISVLFLIVFASRGEFSRRTILKESTSQCATFMIESDGNVYVAHNLDEAVPVYGLVFINKRGVKKKNLGWKDFYSLTGYQKKEKRIEWVSKYGSITYNAWGKEFIDGGVNEKGLYIGEMTMWETQYPEYPGKPKMHHHLYMQYVLDNFATVQEYLDNINNVAINGHCIWHYFVADPSGAVAIVEFYDGKTHIYTGEDSPVKILCNRRYDKELAMMPENEKEYQEMIDKDYYEKDLRFMLGNKMINDYKSKSEGEAVDYAFSILKKMDFGYNRWQIVYDLTNLRMYFRSNLAKEIKYLSFNDFTFEHDSPIKVYDVHSDEKGDVSGKFINYTKELNKQYLIKDFKEIDFGFLGNLLFKKRYINLLNEYSNQFK
ncbi:MAG: linear amide C-N hydrolase [bacterium]|nr:linear amide C-N hydrolase [bacterium]